MTKLSIQPLVHPSAEVHDTILGQYTEISEGCRISEATIGDYSYIMQQGSVWCAEIGKFANIASSVRINAPNHPTWRATLHHFTYRAGDYWPDGDTDVGFFAWRRDNRVIIGHDVWIGHGATILPGVTIGDGAAIGAGAVVSKNVAPYTIVGGVPAKLIRRRFPEEIAERFQRLAWWNWDHDTLRTALPAFRTLSADEFLREYNA